MRVDSAVAPHLTDDAKAQPAQTRRLRLLSPVLILVAGSALVFGAARGWDAIRHEHGGGHGAPALPTALEKAMMGPFVAANGRSVTVLDASCAGEGEAHAGGYTHFSCRLVFEDGDTDEVVVHLREGDELFFKSSVDAAR
jgi:hypothetical protein